MAKDRRQYAEGGRRKATDEDWAYRSEPPAVADGKEKDEGGMMKDEVVAVKESPSSLIFHPSSLR
jgi:hypothetical protein